MRIPIASILVYLLAVTAALGASVVPAQDVEISRKHHPWGAFEPGAWKLVRVATETLDEQGQVLSLNTTETRTTLVSVEPDGVTLCVEVVVEVAGKRFDATPQTIKQGFHGELFSTDVKLHHEGEGTVTVDGQKIHCQIHRLDIGTPNATTTTRIFYCPTVAPYVFRRELSTSDPTTKNAVNSTTVEVLALAMPTKVLGDIKDTALVRTVHQHAKGTITTLAVTCEEVPGGVVSHSSKELDIHGRPVRRSTLELVSYGRGPGDERSGAYARKRPPRKTKTPSRSGSGR